MKATKIVTFSAGHRLSNYKGLCYRLHGHNYSLAVTVSSNVLDEHGFVVDFTELKMHLNAITNILDHKTMLYKNDPINKKIAKVVPKDWIVWFNCNPTAENIAKYIVEKLKENTHFNIIQAKLWETSTSYAECELTT